LYEYNTENSENQENQENQENDEEQNLIIPSEIENEMILRIINIVINNIELQRNSHEFIIYNNYIRYINALLNNNSFIEPIKTGIKYFINVTTFTMLTSFGLYTGFNYANKFISYFS
jgi:hypothetical protein